VPAFSVDVAVVGGGIAGAAAAWWVAQSGASVVVIEREPQPGLHATGRSAATLSETSGHPVVCALAAASRTFFEHPPVGFAPHPLTSPKGLVWIGRREDAEALDRIGAVGASLRSSVRRVDENEARSLVPGLRPGAVTGGAVHEPDAVALDVALALECFLRGLRPSGGKIMATSEAIFGNRRRGRWTLEIGGERVEAAAVINAAGAWGDQLAERCGVAPLGLRALRRTAAIASVPEDRAQQVATWPLVMDVADRCYFEPDQGGLLISPADEHPSSPCDAQADELDVAWALEQVGEITGLALRHIRRSWAGLRTFTRDRAPAVGADPTAEGFIWLVGQGGAGIKTAPALGALAAAAALGTTPPPLATAVPGLELSVLDPGRFGGRRPAMITPAGS
jgi:D-arginine dehydrogenase